MVRREEEYIIDESPEISIGEVEGWVDRIVSPFPALRYRNYQLYFFGQLISLIGTWMQFVAQGWLVLQLSGSAFYVGLVAALGTLPVLLFALAGGVIVDRFRKKNILLITQTVMMALVLLLGFLTIFHMVSVLVIGVIVFLLGMLDSVDRPARQSFAVEMVGKEDLDSAIALNSGIFNGARVIGPAIAGILLAIYGSGGVFLLNGISYIAVIIALLAMRVEEQEFHDHPHPIQAIKEGLSYVYEHSMIRLLLIFAGVTSIFGWSYSTMIPVIVQNVFHKAESELGYFYVFSGIGALVGIVLLSKYQKTIHPFVFMLGGNMLFAASIIAFSFSYSFVVSLFFLFFAGLGIMVLFSTINSAIQHMVEDQLRGRVMSLYTLMFLGMAPIGNLQIGWIAQRLGPLFAVRTGGIVVFIVGIFLLLLRKKLTYEFDKHREQL